MAIGLGNIGASAGSADATFYAFFNQQGGNDFVNVVAKLSKWLDVVAEKERKAAQAASALEKASRSLGAQMRHLNRAYVNFAAQMDRFIGGVRRGIYFVGVFSGFITFETVRAIKTLFRYLQMGTAAVIEMSSAFERLRIQLRTVFREAGEAEKVFGFLTELAKKTPFQLTDVVEGAAALKAVGVDIRQTVAGGENVLTLISDMAGALGRTIPEAIFSFKEAVAEGSWISLRRRFSITMGQIEGVLKKVAKDSGKSFEEAFDFGTVEGRLEALSTFIKTSYGGGSEALAQTLMGIRSNLQDSLEIFADMVGSSGPMEMMKRSARSLYDLFSDMFDTGEARKWAQVIGQQLVGAVQLVTKTAQGLFKGIQLHEGGKEVPIQVNVQKFVENAVELANKFVDAFIRVWDENADVIGRVSEKVASLFVKIFVTQFLATLRVLLSTGLGKVFVYVFAALRLANLIMAVKEIFAPLWRFLRVGFGGAIKAMEMGFGRSFNIITRRGLASAAAVKAAWGLVSAAVGAAAVGLTLGTLAGGAITSARKDNIDEAKKHADALQTLIGRLRVAREAAFEGNKEALALIESFGGLDRVNKSIRELSKGIESIPQEGNFAQKLTGTDISPEQLAAKTRALVKAGFSAYKEGVTEENLLEKLRMGILESGKPAQAVLGQLVVMKFDSDTFGKAVSDAYEEMENVLSQAISKVSATGGLQEMFDIKSGQFSTEGLRLIDEDATKQSVEDVEKIRDIIAQIDAKIEVAKRAYTELVEAQAAGYTISEEQLRNAASQVAQLEIAQQINTNLLKLREKNVDLYAAEDVSQRKITEMERARIGALSLISLEQAKGAKASLDIIKRLKEFVGTLTASIGPEKQTLALIREKIRETERLNNATEIVVSLARDFQEQIEKASEAVEKQLSKWDALAKNLENVVLKMADVTKSVRDLERFIAEAFGGAKDAELFSMDASAVKEQAQIIREALRDEEIRIEHLQNYAKTLANELKDAAAGGGRPVSAIQGDILGVNKELDTVLQTRLALEEALAGVLTDQIKLFGDRAKAVKTEIEALEKEAKEIDVDLRERELETALTNKQEAVKRLLGGDKSAEEELTKKEQAALDRFRKERGDQAVKEAMERREEISELLKSLKAEQESLKKFYEQDLPALKAKIEEIGKNQIVAAQTQHSETIDKLEEIRQAIIGERQKEVNLLMQQFEQTLKSTLGVDFGQVQQAAAGGDPSQFLDRMRGIQDAIVGRLLPPAAMYQNMEYIRNLVLSRFASNPQLDTRNEQLAELIQILDQLANDALVPDEVKNTMQQAKTLWLNIVVDGKNMRSVGIPLDGSGDSTIDVDAGGA